MLCFMCLVSSVVSVLYSVVCVFCRLVVRLVLVMLSWLCLLR